MPKKTPKKAIIKKHITPPFKKFFPILIFAALLGAALFIAAQLTARQAVAPNAPESEPAAAACGANVVGKCGATGGCVSGAMCTKGGIIQYSFGKPIYSFSCKANKDCAVYCNPKLLLSCAKGCIPSRTGGSCRNTPTPTPTSTKKECDPSVTLARCKGSQPQVCRNYKWVNNGKSCVNGCAGAGICLSCKQGATRCSSDGLSVEKCNNGVYVEVKGCKPNKCIIKNGLVQCSTSERVDACIPDDSYVVCNTLGCNNCPPNIKGYKCTCTAGGFYSCSCGL